MFSYSTALLALLAALALLPHRRRKGSQNLLALLGSLYLGVKLALTQTWIPASGADALQSYKAYGLAVLVLALSGRNVIPEASVVRAVKFLICCLFGEYLVGTLQGVTRPTLFTENNYEMVLVILLTSIVGLRLGKRKWIWLAALASTALMSRSISAYIEFGILGLFLAQRAQRGVRWLAGIGGIASSYALLRLWQWRASNSSDWTHIDRVRFMFTFMRETESWTLWNWALGTPPLSPLSAEACSSLDYYKPLFSAARPDQCYSVILHSFVLRCIWDQGVLGSALLMYLIWRALKVAGLSRGEAAPLLLIPLANSLSVSGFNSEYVMVALAVAVMRSRRCSDDAKLRTPPTDEITTVGYREMYGTSLPLRHRDPLLELDARQGAEH